MLVCRHIAFVALQSVNASTQMGPFLDAEHSLIKNPTGELAKMTYKEVCTLP